jgi:long-chain acyl-CoA synthetase
VPVAQEDPSYLLYTSGTTGRPKGATTTIAGRIAATVTMLAEELDIKTGDAMIHAASLTHGSGSKVLAFFLRGARNLTMAKFDAEMFVHLADIAGATSSFLVPTMIRAISEVTAGRRLPPSVRRVTYGGAPISPDLLSRVVDEWGAVLVQVYGSCEAPHPVLLLRPEDHLPDMLGPARLESAGRPVLQADVRLLRDGADVPVGEEGELVVRTPSLMSGYWNRPEATSEVLIEGWYYTGDIARQDDQGFYFIVDRVRDVIISGGLNIYPAEVERVLEGHPQILEAAVIGVPDGTWGERVKALLVLRGGPPPSAEDIIEYCRPHLAGYKKPTLVEFVEELPHGSTGKLQKRDLRARHWAERDRAV